MHLHNLADGKRFNVDAGFFFPAHHRRLEHFLLLAILILGAETLLGIVKVLIKASGQIPAGEVLLALSLLRLCWHRLQLIVSSLSNANEGILPDNDELNPLLPRNNARIKYKVRKSSGCPADLHQASRRQLGQSSKDVGNERFDVLKGIRFSANNHDAAWKFREVLLVLNACIHAE